jgi:hypothetical protein
LERLFVRWSAKVGSCKVVVSAGPLLSIFLYSFLVRSQRVGLQFEWLGSLFERQHSFPGTRLEGLLCFEGGLEVHPVLRRFAELSLHTKKSTVSNYV